MLPAISGGLAGSAQALKTVRRVTSASGVRITPSASRLCRRFAPVETAFGAWASTAQEGWKPLLRGAAYPIPTPGGAVESAIASHSVAA